MEEKRREQAARSLSHGTSWLLLPRTRLTAQPAPQRRTLAGVSLFSSWLITTVSATDHSHPRENNHQTNSAAYSKGSGSSGKSRAAVKDILPVPSSIIMHHSLALLGGVVGGHQTGTCYECCKWNTTKHVVTAEKKWARAFHLVMR